MFVDWGDDGAGVSVAGVALEMLSAELDGGGGNHGTASSTMYSGGCAKELNVRPYSCVGSRLGRRFLEMVYDTNDILAVVAGSIAHGDEGGDGES